jgi:hypothetical protein
MRLPVFESSRYGGLEFRKKQLLDIRGSVINPDSIEDW